MNTKYLLFIFIIFAAFHLPADHLPDWYPKNYTLNSAAEKINEVLKEQNHTVSSEGVENLIFSDADHTLFKTTTPILLRHKMTGEILGDPKTGFILKLSNRSFLNNLENLKTEYPEIDWENYTIDFQEMGSIVAIEDTAPIVEMVNILRLSELDEKNREFIITARSSTTIPPAFHDYFSLFQIELDGTFAVNNPALAKQLGWDDHKLTAAEKKAITMATLITLYQSKGNGIKKASFYDDGDDNLQKAMELLPSLFPDIQFMFYDVIHVGDHRFTIDPVAVSNRPCNLLTPNGNCFFPFDIQNYKSNDAPLPDEH